MKKLLYIGKSNKKFTNNKLYNFNGDIEYYNVTVYANKGMLVTLGYSHYDYFYDNFKILNEEDINKFIRKNKIKKIQNNG